MTHYKNICYLQYYFVLAEVLLQLQEQELQALCLDFVLVWNFWPAERSGLFECSESVELLEKYVSFEQSGLQDSRIWLVSLMVQPPINKKTKTMSLV